MPEPAQGQDLDTDFFIIWNTSALGPPLSPRLGSQMLLQEWEGQQTRPNGLLSFRLESLGSDWRIMGHE